MLPSEWKRQYGMRGWCSLLFPAHCRYGRCPRQTPWHIYKPWGIGLSLDCERNECGECCLGAPIQANPLEFRRLHDRRTSLSVSRFPWCWSALAIATMGIANALGSICMLLQSNVWHSLRASISSIVIFYLIIPFAELSLLLPPEIVPLVVTQSERDHSFNIEI